MSADEFGGIAFAPGAVRGTRAFEVDKLGRLTGVVYKQVWRPGENNAECRKNDEPYRAMWNKIMVGSSAHGGRMSGYQLYSTIPTEPQRQSWIDAVLGTGRDEVQRAAEKARAEKEEREKREAEERAKDTLANCQHGFYGYYDGSNDYYKRGMVMGVVEGYGETIVGTRGFRSMKARIVALRIPKHVPDRIRTLILRNYSEIPVFETFKQMVSEFPPDAAGAELSPDSDPDFWSRTV